MLQDQIAVVTGGESGIGAACVAELARQGARVAFTFFEDEAAAARSQAAAGGEAHALPVRCDVSDVRRYI